MDFFPPLLCWMFLFLVKVKLYVNCILRGDAAQLRQAHRCFSYSWTSWVGFGSHSQPLLYKTGLCAFLFPFSQCCVTCMWTPKCFLRFRWGKPLFILVSSHIALENGRCSALHSATIAISFFPCPSSFSQWWEILDACSLCSCSLFDETSGISEEYFVGHGKCSHVLWWEVHITQIFVGFIVLA